MSCWETLGPGTPIEAIWKGPPTQTQTNYPLVATAPLIAVAFPADMMQYFLPDL